MKYILIVLFGLMGYLVGVNQDKPVVCDDVIYSDILVCEIFVNENSYINVIDTNVVTSKDRL